MSVGKRKPLKCIYMEKITREKIQWAASSASGDTSLSLRRSCHVMSQNNFWIIDPSEDEDMNSH
jgi:hypothetical protein